MDTITTLPSNFVSTLVATLTHMVDHIDRDLDDEELTIYELDFLNENVVVVPLNALFPKNNKTSVKDSSSTDDIAPIGSIFKKRIENHHLYPSFYKRPKKNYGDLLENNDIPSITAELGCSIEEVTLFVKEKNIKLMIDIALKKNEDFLNDINTLTILQQQHAIQQSILQVTERRRS